MNRLLYIFTLILLGLHKLPASEDHKVMIVIIDGTRYSETLGDTTNQYTPNMWDLAFNGTIANRFFNNGVTYTKRAVPALWCGTWTATIDTIYNGSSTIYAKKPTLFEYYRKDKLAPESDCYYMLPYIPNLWLPSFDVDYGPEYWPTFYSQGENDNDVAENTKIVIDNYHPKFLLIYLPDVDHAGHSGDWNEYTSAISNADEIVGDLWHYLQNDPFYEGTTTMIVTNDHGRHDDEHGGFQGHGCGCEGCRHIQFFALGPNIKQGHISNTYRTIPDMAVTAAHILGVDPVKATGEVMHEIFESSTVQNFYSNQTLMLSIFPNPVKAYSQIKFTLRNNSDIYVELTDIFGRRIEKIALGKYEPGNHTVPWMELGFKKNAVPGIHFLSLISESGLSVQKIVIEE